MSISIDSALIEKIQVDTDDKWDTQLISYSIGVSPGFYYVSEFSPNIVDTPAINVLRLIELIELWDDLIAPAIEFYDGYEDANVIINTANNFPSTTAGVTYDTLHTPGLLDDADVFLRPDTIALDRGPWRTALHEFGHALGLAHPGDYDAADGPATYENDRGGARDTVQFTIMSYFEPTNFDDPQIEGSSADINWRRTPDYPGQPTGPQTPMLYDILAIQAIYGADTTTRTGDTIYGFGSNAGRSVYDFVQNPTPVLTIWDAGGRDRLDATFFNADQRIDLHEGSFSNIGDVLVNETWVAIKQNVAIAFGTWIEDAAGGAGSDWIIGNHLSNRLEGNGGFDFVQGEDGDDHLFGGAGEDRLFGDGGKDTLYGGLDNDRLAGGDEADDLLGEGGNDALEGGDGDDKLTGGQGGDTIDGGPGYDTAYYTDSFDAVKINLLTGEASGGEADGDKLVGVESVFGSTLDDELAGDNGPNSLFGGRGNDVIKGGGGADVLDGGEDIDTLTFAAASGPVLVDLGTGVGSWGEAQGDIYLRFENLVGSYFGDILLGTDERNVIDAGNGDDLVFAQGGPDSVEGGIGADVLYAGDGDDLLKGSGGDDELYGGGDADTLRGGADNDRLSGGAGEDFLYGQGENDTYILDDAWNEFVSVGGLFIPVPRFDHVIENPDEGTDTVEVQRVAIGFRELDSYTLPDNVENGVVKGASAFDLDGNGLGNTLTGNDAANTLRGFGGEDVLKGAGGADVLEGGADHDELYGGSGYDTLKGGGGADTLDGGGDFDYAAYDASPEGVVVDLAAGTGKGGDAEGDTLTAIEWVIGSNHADKLYGDAGANELQGLDGNDVLDGRGGRDTMYGGIGDDTYYVDDFFETAVEFQDQGVDTVYAASFWSLGANFENLTLLEVGTASGYGNELDNVLRGNAATNGLYGYGGRDVLIGGRGDDFLDGGADADTFVYRTGDGLDTIINFGWQEGDVVDLRGVAGVHRFQDLTLTLTDSINTTIAFLTGTIVMENLFPFLLQPYHFLFSQAPTGLALSGATVAEDAPAGSVVGTLATTDPDAGETFTYSLLDNAGGRFAVDGAKLVVAGALDYETAPALGVTVRVTDSAGNTLDRAFTIGVTNVAETATGTNGNDVIDIGPGNVVEKVSAGGGNDVINIAPGIGTVVVDAGPGNDIINGNGSTILSFASAPGPVVFNFVNGAGFRQAVMKDLATGIVTPLQTRTGETDPTDFGSSDNPSFSPDGKLVAIQSTARLDPAYPGGSWNIWVKNLETGTTTLVSSSAAGVIGNNNSLATEYRVAWSPDGTKIAFTSQATNFVANDTNGLPDIFIKTISGPNAGQIVRVSEGTGGVQATDATAANVLLPHGSYGPRFSPDGKLLLFWSSADNFAPGDANGQADVFLKVLDGANAGATYLLSRTAAGTIGDRASIDPVFSPDGKSVVFRSASPTLGATANDLFLKDISAVYAGGDPSAGTLTKIVTQGFQPAFSPDGTKVAYYNGQIYVYDLASRTSTIVSTNAAGQNGNTISQSPAWSPDGTKIVFLSTATNLVPGDTNGAIDIFVKTISGPDAGAIQRASVDVSGVQGNANSLFPTFSTSNSTLVAFETDANNLYVPQTGVGSDKFSGVNGLWGTPFNDILVNSTTGPTALPFATFRGEAGSDVLQGSTASIDEMDYRDSPAGIVVTMLNNPSFAGFGSVKDGWGGTDTIRSAEVIQGSEHGDVMTMEDLPETVYGNGGDDVINGLGGADVIFGGAGADRLAGGRGDDTLTGGPGPDTFVFRAGDGTDTITDYNPAEGDRIDLTGVPGVFSLADLKVTQVGSDTVITLGSGLVLKNVQPSALAPSQFLFSGAPTAVALSKAVVAENSAAGTVVGTLSATDPDPGDTFTFTLLDDAGGRFALSGANVVVAGALDYETAASHNILVRATDAIGNSVTKSLAIGVTDVASAAAVSTQPTQFFLKLAGMRGDSTVAGKEGWFDLGTYVFSIRADGGGNTFVSPLTLALDEDTSLGALLSRYALTQQLLPAVQLVGRDAAGHDVQELRLANVNVANAADSKFGGDVFTLGFGKLAAVTRTFDPNGGLAGTQTFGYDVVREAAIDPATVPAPGALTGTPRGDVAAPARFFLLIDGVRGDTTDARFPGWFDVGRYDFDIAEAASGRSAVSPLMIGLANGSSLGSVLQGYALTQQALPAVQLVGVSDGPNPQPTYELRLAGVKVAATSDSTFGIDRFDLSFGKFALTTKLFSASNGTLLDSQSVGYDVAAHATIDPATVPTPGVLAGAPRGAIDQPSSFFLRIAGMRGDSTDDQHQGWFDVASFALDIRADAGGKAALSPLYVTLDADSSLGSLLLRYAATQQVLPAVQLVARNSADGSPDPYDLRLADVRVVSASDGGIGEDRLVFEFGKAALTTRVTDASGSVVESRSFGWDTAAGASIDPATVPTPAVVPASPYGVAPPGTQFFLKLPGLRGDSPSANHPGWFDVDHYRVEVEADGAGRPQFSTLEIALRSDAGALLWQHALTQQALSGAQLVGVLGGPSPLEVYDLRLADVRVASLSDGPFGGAVVALQFGKLALTTRVPDATGSFADVQRFGFDLAAGTVIDPATVPAPGSLTGAPAAALAPPSEFFLKIAGVRGDSTDADHAGWFDVDAYRFDVHTDASGKAIASPLEITLDGDSSLGSLLLRYASTQQLLPAVQLTGRPAGEGAQDTYELRLADVRVASAGDRDVGRDSLTLSFGKLALVSTVLGAAGNVVSTQAIAYDVAAGATIDPAAVPAPGADATAPHGDIGQPTQFFLRIDDLTGDATAEQYRGWFDVAGYQLDVSAAGGGKAAFGPLVVRLDTDASIGSELLQYAALQTLFGVRLVGLRDGREVYDLRLSDATLTFAGDSALGGDTLNIDFDRLSLTTTELKPDGTPGPSSSFVYAEGAPRGVTLTGGTASDVLAGGAGADVITGGPGDDTLTGGPGPDVFVYRTGDGTDTITDFNPAEGDIIDLRGVLSVGSFGDLLPRITQQGSNTIITLGSGFVLENVAKESLTPAQFLFDQAPTALALSPATVAENSAAGTVVGTLTATDPDPDETLAYALLDSGGGRFAIDGANLVVAGALDYETAPSLDVKVRVTDAFGKTLDKVFAVSITDVNEAPTDIALAGATVVENSAVETVVGTLSGTDPDAGDVLAFSLVDNAGGRFAIDGKHLVVAGGIDYESATSHSITVQATDAGGLSYSESFSIAVVNVTGVTIVGRSRADTINATTTIPGQPLPTGEEDTVFGDDGADSIDALGGDDLVWGGNGADRISGGEGRDKLYGEGGSDRLDGGPGDDLLDGGLGGDVLFGGPGADWLIGGGGGDRLEGGTGDDRVSGGEGDDLFVFGRGFGRDVVTDFVPGSASGDVIAVDVAVFADYQALRAAAQQVDADVVISAADGSAMTLQNVALASLQPGDFSFLML